MRDDDFINLGEIIATLLEYKWLILAVTSMALAIGVFVALVSTPSTAPTPCCRSKTKAR